MGRIELVTVVEAPLERTFRLGLSVDAHEASMRASGERAVAGVTHGTLGLHDSVTWRARHFGFWWLMTSQITEIEAPYRFVDEQTRGPFRFWRHEHLHRFDDVAQVTVLRDVIEFAAPAGPLGWLVEIVGLRRYLRALIVRRNRYLARHAARE